MRQGLPDTIDPEKDACSLYEGVEYARFWDGLQKQNLDELEHLLVRRLLPACGSRILDIGCGFGRLADCYLNRFQQVVMADGSVSLLHQAMEKTNGRAVYVACDALHLPFRKAVFDAVLLIRVFHHIQDSQSCLSETNRVLCRDGRFIFNYMNKQNPSRVARWLLGAQQENPFTLETTGCGSTFISHHPKTVSKMLRVAGFARMRFFGAGVLDRLAGRLGYSNHWIGLGEYLAPMLGASWLAPWILCGAEATTNAHMAHVATPDDLFQCPACGECLSEMQSGYRCVGCNRLYPLEDGIFDFRIR